MKFYIALFCLTSCITLNAAQVAKTLTEEQEEAQQHRLTAKMSYYVACNFIGHLKKLEALLQQNPDVLNAGPVTVIDDGAMPLLQYAIEKGRVSAVALFIKYGANINDTAGYKPFGLPLTPLTHASLLGRKKIVQLLIENQVNLEYAIRMTALMTAARSNNYAIVSMLIAAGANKNTQNVHDHHKTAFDYAAARSTIHNREQFQNRYLAAVEAGDVERNRYLAAQKIARKKIENYIPIKDLAKIVVSYAYGQSPADLPEQKGKNNCTIQ